VPPSDPIRLLRIVARLNVGGPAVHLGVLDEKLAPPEYDTLVVTGTEGAAEGNYLALSGRRPAKLTVLPDLGREIDPRRDIATVRQLIRVIRDFRPHIVETHTAKAGALGRMAAWWCGVPVVTHTFHGHVFSGYFRPHVAQAFVLTERVLARATTCLIAVSESVRREVQAAGVGRRTRFEVIPLGLNLAPFADAGAQRGGLRASLGLPPDALVVGFVARLAPIKAPSLLLDVASRVVADEPRAQFVVAGDGELRAEVEARIVHLGLADRVHLLGWRGDLPAVYADCDLVMLTSRNEGSPVALIEAQAAGRAVVATGVGGVADVVQDGVTGILRPFGDVDGLASAVLRLLRDRPLRLRFGEAARRSATERFGAARLGHDMRRLYGGLIAASAASR
jgi:glycosyltransferase involved in cell wall biosynthesis